MNMGDESLVRVVFFEDGVLVQTMAQVRILGVAVAALVGVSFAALVILSHVFSLGVGLGAILVEALVISVLALPALYFILLRPQIAARQSVERKVGRLARALEEETAAHRQAEEVLRSREEELRRHAHEIEYNQSFIEAHAAEMVALAEKISAQKSDIEESKRLSDYTANHDLLTGLPNRRNFQNKLAETIAEAERQGGEVGLIYIDLDKFKAVNDKLGHERGDALLQEVAERLRASLPADQVAARLGGDEFAVIVSAPAGLGAVVTDLAAALGESLKINVAMPEGAIVVGASLGFALFPQDGSNAADILRRADQAMYVAKGEKSDGVVAHGDIATARLKATGS